MKDVTDIEVVADRTAASRPDEGFLRVRRLVLRNRYEDGSASAEYACDVVSRLHADAVAVVLYQVGADGRVRVALKTGVRPPAWLRADGRGRAHPLMPEIVAGMLEPGDEGPGGVERRAALECREEAGYDVDPAAVRPLGAALYASPGITDELVHYRAVETDLDRRGEACGDGSVMEEAGDVLVLGLEEALRRCLRGAIPDAKTEIGLRRLRAALGPRPRPGGPLAGDARGQGSEET